MNELTHVWKCLLEEWFRWVFLIRLGSFSAPSWGPMVPSWPLTRGRHHFRVWPWKAGWHLGNRDTSLLRCAVMTEVFGDFKEHCKSKCLVRVCDRSSVIVRGTEAVCGGWAVSFQSRWSSITWRSRDESCSSSSFLCFHCVLTLQNSWGRDGCGRCCALYGADSH